MDKMRRYKDPDDPDPKVLRTGGVRAMKRSLMILLWSALLLTVATCRSEAVPGWLEGGIFPDEEIPASSVEAPSWGAWFMSEGVWVREAENPDSDKGQRYFVNINGGWIVFDGSEGDVALPCDPPEWYPWQDTPEKRGLAPKGKDENLEIDRNSSFSWGEWEDHFGGWFRRITPPGKPLMGATHLVDGNGSCYILVVYPGATPRSVERFSWFPGFPPGWIIKPGATVLVKKAAE